MIHMNLCVCMAMRTYTLVASVSCPRLARQSSLSRMTSKVGIRVKGAVKSKVKQYKRLLAGE